MTYTNINNMSSKIEDTKYCWEIKKDDKIKYYNDNKCYNGAVQEELENIFGKENIRVIDDDEKQKIKMLEAL